MSFPFQRVLTQTVNLSIGFDSPLRLLCMSLKTEGASVLLSQLPRSSSQAQGFPSSIRPFRLRSTGHWDSHRVAGLGHPRSAKQSSFPARVPGWDHFNRCPVHNTAISTKQHKGSHGFTSFSYKALIPEHLMNSFTEKPVSVLTADL